MRRLPWVIQMSSKFNDKCSYIRETEDGETQKRGDNVTVEAEIGVLWPQAEECLKPPEGGKAEAVCPSLEPSEGAWPCWHHYFRPQASRTVRE